MQIMIKTTLTILGAGALAVALLSAPADALAARGGNGNGGNGNKDISTPATLTFGDATGDHVRSDGLGSHAATIDSTGNTLELSTGARAIYFDFSNVVRPDSFDPFGGGATAGWISDVSISISSLNSILIGEPDPNKSLAGATFLFTAPAPNGSGPTEWRLTGPTLDLLRVDTDGDGVNDRYELSTMQGAGYVAALAWLDDPVNKPVKEGSGGRGGGGPPYHDDGWRSAGWFDMQWTADVARQ